MTEQTNRIFVAVAQNLRIGVPATCFYEAASVEEAGEMWVEHMTRAFGGVFNARDWDLVLFEMPTPVGRARTLLIPEDKIAHLLTRAPVEELEAMPTHDVVGRA